MSKSIVKITAVLVPAILVTLALVVVGAGAFSQNANSSTVMDMPQATPTPGDSEVQTISGGVQESLTGTYVGTVRMTGGHEMSGPARLTLSGNTFTLELTDGSMTHSGRLFAVTTRGYTGAALYFTDINDPQTNTPLAASVRIRQRGNSITATPVPGSHNRLSFRGRSE